MKLLGVLLLAATLAGPAYGQTKSELSCGTLTAESWKTAATSHWTIAGPTEKTTETGVLKSGPRFECIEGVVLGVEFASSAGHSTFTAYLPDGTNIAYGRQQIDRRGGRIVFPIQAKARIAAPYRAAFDYHCRLDMPADPIKPATRADCLF